jgi:hypothetical protein
MCIVIGILIILIIVIIYFFAFPALFLIKSSNINGYWVDIFGNIYNIVSTGRLTFNVIHNKIHRNGIIRGLLLNNTIQISTDTIPIHGIYNTKSNTIVFNNGVEWFKSSF